jgi:hypothetical protein
VQRLEYEANARMAAKQMLAICKEARAASGGALVRVACVHRVGPVPVGEASIAIAASSPHRREAIAAVGFILDEVKARAAVWKREVYADGGASWKENCECGWRGRGAEPPGVVQPATGSAATTAPLPQGHVHSHAHHDGRAAGSNASGSGAAGDGHIAPADADDGSAGGPSAGPGHGDQPGVL